MNKLVLVLLFTGLALGCRAQITYNAGGEVAVYRYPSLQSEVLYHVPNFRYVDTPFNECGFSEDQDNPRYLEFQEVAAAYGDSVNNYFWDGTGFIHTDDLLTTACGDEAEPRRENDSVRVYEAGDYTLRFTFAIVDSSHYADSRELFKLYGGGDAQQSELQRIVISYKGKTVTIDHVCFMCFYPAISVCMGAKGGLLINIRLGDGAESRGHSWIIVDGEISDTFDYTAC